MSEIPKGSLQDRLAAMRARDAQARHKADFAAYARSIPVLAALEAMAADYRSDGYRGLSGPLNLWAHDPSTAPALTRSWTPVQTGSTGREEVAAAHLDRLQTGRGRLLVILRDEALVIDVAASHVSALLPLLVSSANGSEVGITADGADWLIEINRRGVALLGLTAAP